MIIDKEYFRQIGREVGRLLAEAMKSPPEGHPFYGNQWVGFGSGTFGGREDNAPRTIDDIYQARVLAGNKVSNSFAVKGKAIEKEVNSALNAVDSVHNIEGLPDLEIRTGAGSALGVYQYKENRSGSIVVPVKIGINPAGDHKELTTVHEVGHFIDQQSLGISGKFSSEDENSDAGKIVSALRDTESYKNLGVLEYTMPDGTTKSDSMSIKSIRYYRNPTEVFARAYAQYITKRSGNEAMSKQLDKIRSTSYKRTQWTDEEFEPVSKQFDAMFDKKGWKK